jgi:DNA-binding NarL/FixJ family response regulator
MRVVLIGPPADRARVRAHLVAAAIDIAGEFATLAAADASGLERDAVVVAGADRRTTDGRTRSSRDAEAFDEPLTARERQVLDLLAEGLPNKAIARTLAISDQTVKFHVAAICGKLGAANRTEAVRRALRRGLITI